jgi:2-haloacid dehalogenase
MKKRAIKAVVFDAYGTLFDVHSVVRAGEELFPGQGAALSQLWRSKQLEYTWLRSLMGRYKNFWEVTEAALVFACKKLGLSCPPAARKRLMDAYLALDPYPEVREGLRALSRYRLAILSNGAPRMLQAAVKHAGLAGMFAQVLSVDAVRIFKPSPRVYQLAPRKLRIPRASIAFVSANFWDIAGAKAFGLVTCWVNRSGAPADELGLAADIAVSNLTELAAALSA